MQLLEFKEDPLRAIDNSGDVDVIYLDFKKAFDKAPHGLLKIVHGYGIRGKVYSWIKTFLTNRKQRVVVVTFSAQNGKNVPSGIPQSWGPFCLSFSYMICKMQLRVV